MGRYDFSTAGAKPMILFSPVNSPHSNSLELLVSRALKLLTSCHSSDARQKSIGSGENERSSWNISLLRLSWIHVATK